MPKDAPQLGCANSPILKERGQHEAVSYTHLRAHET